MKSLSEKTKSTVQVDLNDMAFSWNRLLRAIFIVCCLRPIVWLLFGLNRYDRIRVPCEGPFILAPNHNSHLDVLLIAALLPLKQGCRIKTAAAADYFWKNPVTRWFVFGLFSAIPVWRVNKTNKEKKSSVVSALDACLKSGHPVLIFPEGTRGNPDAFAQIKSGVARLAVLNPEIAIVPLVFSGLGKALPKGSKVLLPVQPRMIKPEWIFGKGLDVESVREKLHRVFIDSLRQMQHQKEVG